MAEIDEMKMPDAAAEPQAYREALLDVIGERDPLEVLAETPARVRELVAGRDAAELERRPADGEWSAAQVISHLVDVDVVYGFRWRLSLTEDRPSYPGYDQKLWSQLPRPPADHLCALLDMLRAHNVWLLRAIPRADWSRVGVQVEQRPRSLDGSRRPSLQRDRVALHAHLHPLPRTPIGAALDLLDAGQRAWPQEGEQQPRVEGRPEVQRERRRDQPTEQQQVAAIRCKLEPTTRGGRSRRRPAGTASSDALTGCRTARSLSVPRGPSPLVEANLVRSAVGFGVKSQSPSSPRPAPVKRCVFPANEPLTDPDLRAR